MIEVKEKWNLDFIDIEDKHKKCPFCAHDKQSIYYRETDGFGWFSVKYYNVRCNSCGAEGPEERTEEEAWKAWDKRKRNSDKS
jgi:Lar family restriction alleviation protein